MKLVAGEKANVNSVFKLIVSRDRQLPVKMYAKLDISFFSA